MACPFASSSGVQSRKLSDVGDPQLGHTEVHPVFAVHTGCDDPIAVRSGLGSRPISIPCADTFRRPLRANAGPCLVQLMRSRERRDPPGVARRDSTACT